MVSSLLLVSATLAANLSGSALVEATILAYHAEARECHRPVHILSGRGQRILGAAITQACEQVWPGQVDRPAWLFALKLTETYVGPSNHRPARERTFGPWCLTVFEAQEAAIVLGISLPRASRDIVDVLQDDYTISALLAAFTLSSYEHTSCDRIRGLLVYKYGALGFARAWREAGGPMTDLWPWRRFSQKLKEVQCVQERVQLGLPATCGCLKVTGG